MYYLGSRNEFGGHNMFGIYGSVKDPEPLSVLSLSLLITGGSVFPNTNFVGSSMNLLGFTP